MNKCREGDGTEMSPIRQESLMIVLCEFHSGRENNGPMRMADQ